MNFLNNPRLFRESVIFIYNLQIYLLSTDFCIFAIHKIFHPVGSLYFLLCFQFFIGKDQLVLTDIIIFYEIFFAKLGMVRQKIAFLCIGIHAAFHSCFDLSSGRCSKRGIYCTGSKKSFVIMKSGYIFILLFMCYFIYRNTYTHLLQKGSRI